MTPRTLLEIAVGVAALAFGGFYLSAREDSVRMQAVIDAQAQAQKQYREEIDTLSKQMADREAAYQQQLQSLDKKFSAARSPEELAQLVSQLMGLKQPIQITTAPASPGNPNPQSAAQVPQIDFPQAKAYVQACEECKAENAKLKADASDREAQAKLAQQQIESLKTQRDAAIKAAKGSMWQRVGRAAKWLAIGGAVGYIAAKH